MTRKIAWPPGARGRLEQNVDLAPLTWFRVGGPAEWLFSPIDEQDLISVLLARPQEMPVTVIGAGSNLLVRDGGVPGLVIRLGEGFSHIHIDDMTIEAGGSAMAPILALKARRAAIDGFDFLAGIPGTVGGILAMNAGAHGRETAQLLEEARIITQEGVIDQLKRADLNCGYRRGGLPENAILLSARFRGQPGQSEAIACKIADIQDYRWQTQPIQERTGGSTFTNPEGYKAWELIEQAGCRGLRCGGARVSDKHCNFLINAGQASARDLENLGEQIRMRVVHKTGIDLAWEIRKIGIAPHEDVSL